MTIYQLGKIKLQVDPASISIEKGVSFAEQPRLVSKPTLQATGGILEVISLSFIFHYSFCDPRQSVEDLSSAMYLMEPLDFIDGSGYSYGEFVIDRFSYEVEKADGRGVPLIISASVNMIEYVPDEDSPSRTRAKKDGFASVKVNPIQVKPTPLYQSPSSLVMRDVVATKTAATSVSSNTRKAAAIPALAAKYLREGKRGLDRAKTAAQTAKSNVDAVQGQISNAQTLKDSLDSVISDLTNLNSNYTVSNISSLSNIAAGMDININKLMAVATELTAVVALRK